MLRINNKQKYNYFLFISHTDKKYVFHSIGIFFCNSVGGSTLRDSDYA